MKYGYNQRPPDESPGGKIRRFGEPGLISPPHLGANRTIPKQAQDLGGSIGDFIPDGSLDPDVLSGDIETLVGWSQDLVFSASDENTVAWASGSIELSGGTTYAITGSNTGNMSALTFIYIDTAVSETLLQTSTTAGDAVGSGKILIAVAENVAAGKKAEFQVFGGKGMGPLLTADNIAANTLTANEIAANTITAGEIAADTLTANEIAATTITGAEILSLSISGKSITADTGSIGGWVLAAGSLTASNLVLHATEETIYLGAATAPMTGVGVFIGKDGVDYEFRAGDPAGNYILWDGSALTVVGGGTFSGALSAPTGDIGGWTINAAELSNGSVKIQSTAERILMGSATAPMTGTGIFIGLDTADYEFRCGNPAGAYLHWDGSALTFTGALSTPTGNIGGWVISGNTLVASNVTLDAGNETILLGSATAPLTGAGIYIGKDSADYEFRCGDPAGDYIHWDGSALEVKGDSFTGANPVFSGTVDIHGGDASKKIVIRDENIEITSALNDRQVLEIKRDATYDFVITTSANGSGTAPKLAIRPTNDMTICSSGAKLGFHDAAPVVIQTGYTTFTNLSTDRTCDADSTTVAELADILGTLIEDLKAKGLVSA